MKRTRSNTKTIGISIKNQKPFRDKTNENLLNSKCKSNVKNVAKKVEALNKVSTKIYNTVRVSICRDATTESKVKCFNTVRVSISRDATTESKVKCLLNKISPEKLVSNTSDVYNFDYDPKLEPKRPIKKKRCRRKKKKIVEEMDTSGEADNSMKPIVQKLRIMYKRNEKQKETIEQSIMVDNNISANENAVVDKINEPFKNISTNNLIIMPMTERVSQIIDINKNIEIPATTSDQSIESSAANELTDITNSFLEDLSDEEGNFLVTSHTHVDIISKMIMRKSNNEKLQNKIFNSTSNSLKVESSPWRLNTSAIPKKPQYFYVKDKSFTPSYNPDIEIRSTNNSSSNGSSVDLSNRINHKLNCTKSSANSKIQTSLFTFVTGSSEDQIKNRKSRGLFEDITSHNKSPTRKFLGELNFNQSTSSPIRSNSMHHSHISPKKKNSDDSLFGFSFISDTDNLDLSEIKENIPQRKSPRKQKTAKLNIPTKISINEIKKVILNEKPVTVSVQPQENRVETVAERIPSPIDDNISVCLFDDLAEINYTKRFSRQYTRKPPQRKKIVSETSYHSDDESDVEYGLPVIRKRKLRTKEEDVEAERLAARYNSMFEDIDKHKLCID